jgi:hypothetical protein
MFLDKFRAEHNESFIGEINIYPLGTPASQ